MPRGQPQGEEVYRPEVNPEDLPRKIVPEVRQGPVIGEAFGRATQMAGEAFERKFQADSATWAGKQIADTRTQTVLDLEKAKSALPADQDPTGFTEKFISRFDKNTNDFVQNSDANPVARAMVQKGLGEFRNQLIQHTTQWEAEQNVAYRHNAIRDYTNSQAAVVEAHPELLPSVGSTAMDMVNSSGADPKVKLAIMRETDGQLSQAAANGLARQNPRAVIEALNNPENAPKGLEMITRLNDAQREAIRDRANKHLSDPIFAAIGSNDFRTAQHALLANADIMDPRTFESAQRGILAAEEHQIVMQQKFEKVSSDKLSKEGDRLLSQGQLSTAWIEKNSAALESNEVRYFYKALSGTEEAATNPKTFADLFLRAAGGEDVRDEARKALTDNHDLSRADFTKIAGIVDQTRPGWYKRGSEFIGKQLEPTPQSLDPFPKKNQAFALRDWDEWAQLNPKATEAEARKEQNELVTHYSLMAPGRIAIVSDAPLYLIGSRTNPVDEQGKPDPTLSATIARYREAVKAGQIKGAEAEQEAMRIMSLRDMLQKQAEAAAKAKAKKEQQ
jgi:hypothetical protein